MKSLKDRLAAVCRRNRLPGAANFADVMEKRRQKLDAYRKAREARVNLDKEKV